MPVTKRALHPLFILICLLSSINMKALTYKIFIEDGTNGWKDSGQKFSMDSDSYEGVLWGLGDSNFYFYCNFSDQYVGGINSVLDWGEETELTSSYNEIPWGMRMKAPANDPKQNVKFRLEQRNGTFFITLIDPEADPEINNARVDYESPSDIPASYRSGLFIEKPYYVNSLIADWYEDDETWCSFEKCGEGHPDILAMDNPAGAKTAKINGKYYILIDNLCPTPGHNPTRFSFRFSEPRTGYEWESGKFVMEDLSRVLSPMTGATNVYVKDVINNGTETYDPDFAYFSDDINNPDRSFHIVKALPINRPGMIQYHEIIIRHHRDYDQQSNVQVEVIVPEEQQKFIHGKNVAPEVADGRYGYDAFAFDSRLTGSYDNPYAYSIARVNFSTPGIYTLRISQPEQSGNYNAASIDIPVRVLPSPEAMKLMVNDQYITFPEGSSSGDHYVATISTSKITRENEYEFGPHRLLFECTEAETSDSEGKRNYQILWGYDTGMRKSFKASRPSFASATSVSDDPYKSKGEDLGLQPYMFHNAPYITEPESNTKTSRNLNFQILHNGVYSPVYNLMVTSNDDALTSNPNLKTDEVSASVYYDLSGRKFEQFPSEPGIYILRKGESTSKVMITQKR